MTVIKWQKNKKNIASFDANLNPISTPSMMHSVTSNRVLTGELSDWWSVDDELERNSCSAFVVLIILMAYDISDTIRNKASVEEK